MKKTTGTTKYIPVTGNGANVISVELYYSKGGYNYFTYKNEPRGYYISVTPLERTVRDGYITESFSAFSGAKMIIEECAP